MTPTSRHEFLTRLITIKKTAVVLIYMLALDGPVGPVELARDLGYNRSTAAGYLESLRVLGLITRTHYHAGYTLSGMGRQLVLGQLLIDASPTVQNLDSGPTTTTLNRGIDNYKGIVVVDSPPLSKKQTVKNYDHLDKNILAILQGAGIGTPKRYELADLPHVTADYLQAHIDVWRNEKDPRKRAVSMLIFRIQSGDPAPVLPASQDQDPRKYTSGKYSDFVKS